MMNILLWTLGILAVLFGIYLYLAATAREKPDTSMLSGYFYAHRGLHDETRGVSENSLTAFDRAASAGYGIELDVQRTQDDQLVVFHDASLKRKCGVDVCVCELDYAAIKKYPLPDGSAIPLFEQALATIGGRVPVLVEIKHHSGAVKNAEMALNILRKYQGPYCVESFHPLAVRYFRKNAPEVLRGQLAWGGKWQRSEIDAVSHFALKHLLVNVAGRPHFIAFSYPQDKTFALWLMRHMFHPKLAAWTIRDARTLKRVLAEQECPIFENFIPK